MNPIKIKIVLEGQLKFSDKEKETVKRITAEIETEVRRTTPKNVLDSRYIGFYDFRDIQQHLNQRREEAIKSFLLSDYNYINFDDCWYAVRFADVNQEISLPSDPVLWQLNFRLTSLTYVCVAILEDKTLICYEHSDSNDPKKIIFIGKQQYTDLIFVP